MDTATLRAMQTLSQEVWRHDPALVNTDARATSLNVTRTIGTALLLPGIYRGRAPATPGTYGYAVTAVRSCAKVQLHECRTNRCCAFPANRLWLQGAA